ncbi:hypothetical protein BGW41_004240 [Actinomortierella wolfii]|nr:hypothetical protein BGW41_004240 [Actinomortierella wolfii]
MAIQPTSAVLKPSSPTTFVATPLPDQKVLIPGEPRVDRSHPMPTLSHPPRSTTNLTLDSGANAIGSPSNVSTGFTVLGILIILVALLKIIACFRNAFCPPRQYIVVSNRQSRSQSSKRKTFMEMVFDALTWFIKTMIRLAREYISGKGQRPSTKNNARTKNRPITLAPTTASSLTTNPRPPVLKPDPVHLGRRQQGHVASRTLLAQTLTLPSHATVTPTSKLGDDDDAMESSLPRRHRRCTHTKIKPTAYISQPTSHVAPGQENISHDDLPFCDPGRRPESCHALKQEGPSASSLPSQRYALERYGYKARYCQDLHQQQHQQQHQPHQQQYQLLHHYDSTATVHQAASSHWQMVMSNTDDHTERDFEWRQQQLKGQRSERDSYHYYQYPSHLDRQKQHYSSQRIYPEMPASSSRRRNQPQRNYKEEDPDDMSLTEDSDALESGDEEDQTSSGFPYEDVEEDFDMEEENEQVPQGRQARGGRRKTESTPKHSSKTSAASSSRSKTKPASTRGSVSAATARSAASTASSRSRKPPANSTEDDDDDGDDIIDEEDEVDDDEEEEEEQEVRQRGQNTRAQTRKAAAKRQEFSSVSSEEEDDDQADMEDEEIDLEDDADELGGNEEEDIDIGMDENQEDEEEEEEDEDEDEEGEEDEEDEESTSTPSRNGARKGAASSGAGRQKGKGRAKGGAKSDFTEDEFSDDDFSTPQPGMGFGGNLTKRQRSKLDGSEALSLDFLELPSAASRKRHRTEEELALKKSELSRRRKNMTAQRAEQDKIDTINRLLKKQAGKRKKGGGDDEDGAGGEGGGARRGEGPDGQKVRKSRYIVPPTYLRTIFRVEGTTLSIPEVSIDRTLEWMKDSIREPKGVKHLVAVSAAAEAEASGQMSHPVEAEAAIGGSTTEPVKVHKPIEILEEPLLPPKAPKYPAPRGHCVVEGCSQTWKYRGVKSKKQVCGLEHLRLVESGSS